MIQVAALAIAFLPMAGLDAAEATGWLSTPDWKLVGPYGGTVRSVALDPQKPDVVLAGGMNSLLFRSTDAAQSWEILPFPKRNLSEVTSILVDPKDSTHYFAGMISAEDGGLFESHDEGKTWGVVKDISHFGVRALAAAPSKPERLLAGTLQGVWMSEDSGQSWKRISDKENLEMQGITVVAVDSKDPNIIYAGTSHLPWRTLDGGKTWDSIHTGMIDDSDVFSIYVDPGNPINLLASACSGIYASGSRGDEWRKLMGIPNTSRRTHVVRADPANSNMIYAGTTTGLFKSLNGGATWKTLSNTQANAMTFDPAHPATVYMGLEYDGIGKSENSGETIKPSNQGFVDRTITAVTQSGEKFFAIETQEGSTSGVFSSTDHGQTWTQLQDVRGLDGVHLKTVAAAPSAANLLLAGSPHRMFRSTDSANTWKPLPIKVVETVTPPPAKAPARSTAKGRTTRARVTKPPKPVVKIHEISPAEISAVYARKLNGSDVFFLATDLGLFKSSDAGDRWTQTVMPGTPAVSALYFSPNPSATMLAKTATGLLSSSDCGDHWENFNFPLPVSDVNEIALPAGEGKLMLAATRVGLYSSPDDGVTWYDNKSKFPASTVSSVIFTGVTGEALAVEYGRLYQTVNSGDSWKEIPTGLNALHIRQLWMPEPTSGRLYGITSELGILFRQTGEIR